ncbi:hypothetical protein ABIA35_009584, partial [Catenulispora sp. MAP12-49]|uniref:helix-turn-helix domain-containing protein n=1 Tax=Catenulispora sp. MAP12-49 TaxID=3156302 RepID=UPI003517A6BB
LLRLKGWDFASFAMVMARVQSQHVRTMGYLDRGRSEREGQGRAGALRFVLARVAQLAFELFRVRHTSNGVSYRLHRMGWMPQVPHRVAAGLDALAVVT